MRTLVIEDEGGMRLLLTRMLERRGHTVVACTDAESALQAWDEEPFALVLLDLWLPGMDGLDFLRILRGLEGGSDAVVLVVTGRDRPEDLEEILAAGADDYVAKPVESAILETRITIALQRVQARQRAEIAEAELAQSRSVFNALFENCPAAITIFASDGTLLRMNAIQRAYLDNCTSLDLVGHYNVLTDGELVTPTGQLFAQAWAGEVVVEHDHRLDLEIICGPGNSRLSHIHADLLLYPIPSETGISAVVAIVQDVTERKQMQAQLLLADRMASVGTIAAGVAHEINNPLAYVSANLAWLAAELPAAIRGLPAGHATEITEVVQEARHGADRVRDIVRELRTFSRSDDEATGVIDLRTVLESAINMAWNEIRHRAQLVKVYGQTPKVACNESRLGQVFLNLLVNAAQAIPAGQADRHEVRVTTRTDADGFAIVEVSDTGSGIAESHIDRLFEPFFTTKPIGEGTGLGLSICHSIVSGLGGEIVVDSKPGRGSVFRVMLPPVREQNVDIPRALYEEKVPDGASDVATVLVVDDEPLVGKAMRRALPKHEVIVCANGREAVELTAAYDFDVIFCDLMMPEVTGMDLYDALEPGQRQRVVFMTGGAFTAEAQRFLGRVPNAVLEKPFDLGRLRALVAERRSARHPQLRLLGST